MDEKLSPLARVLIQELEKREVESQEAQVSVNPMVSEVAVWYEKLRNAMEYKEEEVILRSAIERILNRRTLTTQKGVDIAEPLVKELLWARYFPHSSIPQALVTKVEQAIDLFFKLYNLLVAQKRLDKTTISDWMMDLLSSEIEDILRPSREKNLLSNFIYQIFRPKVTLEEQSQETRDAQVFIAVRRAFAKEDRALLRYHLFLQFFGKVTAENVERIAEDFLDGYQEINKQLNFKYKDKIHSYIKNQIAPFFILEDVFFNHKENLRDFLADEQMFKKEVVAVCNARYNDIAAKVQRAVIRSIIFIFITKAIFALGVEASFENFLYGHTNWFAITLNIFFPPVIIMLASLFITKPDEENSRKILERIEEVLCNPSPVLNPPLGIKESTNRVNPLLMMSFMLLWILALVLVVGSIIYLLSMLGLSAISQAIFIFFLTIVSFIIYRISQTARIYTLKQEREGLRRLLFDFLFMPIIYLGRNITVGISQVNVFLFLFDFFIETPFKEMFAFFEHWFLFLRTQRETLD